ncbi:MAG: M56 family metallopeptidase, partial [Eubacteriales bacterium]|nr:M56 family metallopeptidase [Eubacteriales bacterium]
MTTLFRAILNMSVTGGIAALAVLLLRIPLKRAPRWISYALWAVVFLRLVVPFSFSSPVSLLGGIGAPAPVNGIVSYLSVDHAAATGRFSNPVQDASGAFSSLSLAEESTASFAPTPMASADPMQIWLAIGTMVWLIGIAGLLLYAIIQYIRLQRRVSDAVRSECDVYETDAITSPFVLGVFRPHIILPVGMLTNERKLVLLHERAHIYRFDYLAKPVAFLILTLHWFNPLVWLAFRLFCDDMEASCDERAIQKCNRDEIAAYGETLLRLGTQRAAFAAGPLAFGEHCTKGRIINVLNNKKPAFWIVAVAVLAAVITAIVLLANPLEPPKEAMEPVFSPIQAEAPSVKVLQPIDIKASDFDVQAFVVPD